MRGPEAKVQDKFLREVKKLGFKTIKTQGGMYGQNGVPDCLLYKEGWWGMAEIKAHKNSPKRPGQQEWIDFAQTNSWGAFVYEENLDDILAELKSLV